MTQDMSYKYITLYAKEPLYILNPLKAHFLFL